MEEIRREVPNTCIVLEPEPIPLGYAINLDNNQQETDSATAPAFQALPSEIVQKMTEKVNPDQI